ncbi:MAG: hypothetical protein ABWK53_08195 [Anaerolineales bacterium]
MFTEDYILRMINQALAVLARLAGLKAANRRQEARQAIDQALEILLGLDARLIRQLDDDGLLAALTVGGRLDAERLSVLADILAAEAELLAEDGLTAESRAALLQALNFSILAAWNRDAASPPEADGRITALYHRLGGPPLPEAAALQLEDYCTHLADKSDQELTVAGLARHEIEQILRALRAGK